MCGNIYNIQDIIKTHTFHMQLFSLVLFRAANEGLLLWPAKSWHILIGIKVPQLCHHYPAPTLNTAQTFKELSLWFVYMVIFFLCEWWQMLTHRLACFVCVHVCSVKDPIQNCWRLVRSINIILLALLLSCKSLCYYNCKHWPVNDGDNWIRLE